MSEPEAAMTDVDTEITLCHNGRHPVTAESRYISPTTGKSYCRGCKAERRAAWERQGERVRRRAAVRHRYLRVLSPGQVTRLRAAVACLGCGAAREDIPGGQQVPYTRIRHRKGCPIARNREGGAP